jgi:hypothetical protein
MVPGEAEIFQGHVGMACRDAALPEGNTAHGVPAVAFEGLAECRVDVAFADHYLGPEPAFRVGIETF